FTPQKRHRPSLAFSSDLVVTGTRNPEASIRGISHNRHGAAFFYARSSYRNEFRAIESQEPFGGRRNHSAVPPVNVIEPGGNALFRRESLDRRRFTVPFDAKNQPAGAYPY